MKVEALVPMYTDRLIRRGEVFEVKDIRGLEPFVKIIEEKKKKGSK